MIHYFPCPCRNSSPACHPMTTSNTCFAPFSANRCISVALTRAGAEKMGGLARGYSLSRAIGWAPPSTLKPSDMTTSGSQTTMISTSSPITLKFWHCGRHT